MFAFAFCAPALALTIGVYAVIAARVGWPALVSDSWLLLYNIPPELAYFNKQVSGLGNPVRSLERMLIATVKVVTLGTIVAAISVLRRSDETPSRIERSDDRPCRSGRRARPVHGAWSPPPSAWSS